MWIRKNAPDPTGGLFQIGVLGQPGSVGLAYANDTDLILQCHGAGGRSAMVAVSNELSVSLWKHCVAAWRNDGSGLDLWLFVDGRYVGYSRLDAILNLSVAQMQVGVAAIYGLANVRIDELRFFTWRLSDDEVFAEYVVSAGRHHPMPTAKPRSTGPVQVAGKALSVNGQPYVIKGVGYQPTPIGTTISQSIIDFIYTDSQILARDMPILRSMGANTIRTWSQPPDQSLLDACYNGGVQPIRVIVGYWVPQYPGINYSDPATAAAIEVDFRALINQFKSHPALLAWGIGNENNLNYGRSLSEWYALANDLAGAAYEEEGASYHPCIVVNGGLQDLGDTAQGSDDAAMSMVDIWGVNAYPGESFHCFFRYFDQISAKPAIVTEYGIDVFDNRAQSEYEAVQAQFVVAQWRELRAGCLGGTAMAYSDEWWKAGEPATHDPGGYGTAAHPDGYSNEEWWGILRPIDSGAAPDELVPRQAYQALAHEFFGPPGDMDCDGAIDMRDIPPFVQAVIDPDNYHFVDPACPFSKADMNADAHVDGADIVGFVAALVSV